MKPRRGPRRWPRRLGIAALVVLEVATLAPGLLKNVARHQVVPLEGGHYLHWTQSRRMAEEIRRFVAPGG
ncbi:hypothetical protein ACFFGR_19780 [Arthrobacter liuii]|uniref:Alpha/beta hydrolase n=1 Tax=Arthrobacter liuii TaxID=1476996 RepID=A0ABQ2AF94_9MICC|nr:hypothetical protein [Arthrobacter liuii]GGH90882.1 hypothetical protein GCM10007170_05710 [Arthrobacter liuii]